MKKLICLIIAVLCLTVSCSAPTSQTTTSAPPASTEQVTEPDLSKLVLYADSWSISADSSADLSKTSLILDAYKDDLSGDTVFSGVIIKAIRLEASKAGKLSIASYSNAENSQIQWKSFDVKEGENLLELDLTVEYGDCLAIGTEGDSAVISASTKADGPLCASTGSDTALTIKAQVYSSGYASKNLIGLDIENEFPLKYSGCSSLFSEDGPYAFAYNFFEGTTINTLKFAVSAAEPGDTFTVSVVKADLCGGGKIKETLNSVTHTFKESLEDCWYTWEGLDLEVPEGYTLAFLSRTDTLYLGHYGGELGRTLYQRELGFFAMTDNGANSSYLKCFLPMEIHATPKMTDASKAENTSVENSLYAPLSEEELSKLKSYLSGKSLSLLGDSITTYQNVSNNTEINTTIGGNAVYYSPAQRLYLADTWWNQLIKDSEMTLCVNNAWSGSLIWGGNGNIWQSRCVNLHIDTDYAKTNSIKAEPDVILVWMGTNDYNGNHDLGTALTAADVVTADGFAEPQNVCQAYYIALSKMKERYPNSEILLMSPFSIKCKNDPDSKYLEQFNTELKAVGELFGFEFINLHADSGITYMNNSAYTHGDCLHPNEEGMDLITACVERALIRHFEAKK
ncbi:MAG: SGNH/GDSL hydrolase family protein [Ruminococcaceae bacterium]|nr:SGNH/GDSL hydrolase family protein [Oscillospiraceae bacterium]